MATSTSWMMTATWGPTIPTIPMTRRPWATSEGTGRANLAVFWVVRVSAPTAAYTCKQEAVAWAWLRELPSGPARRVHLRDIRYQKPAVQVHSVLTRSQASILLEADHVIGTPFTAPSSCRRALIRSCLNMFMAKRRTSGGHLSPQWTLAPAPGGRPLWSCQAAPQAFITRPLLLPATRAHGRSCSRSSMTGGASGRLAAAVIVLRGHQSV
mmetsp:Transcript_78704/g.168668  ORF Transcript_78704/g.168668 Transcript_78704/m.168668 type:complete len:211 (+) Transcript_78704:2332-2964(+)